MKFSLDESLSFLKKPAQASLQSAARLDLRMGEVSRYFSGAVFQKAAAMLDKATLWIILITWIVATLSIGAAFMSVRAAADLKMKADTARALQPVIPKITRAPLTRGQYMPLYERIKKEFPTLTFEVTARPGLRIFSNNGDDFSSWLNAIGFADSMVPTIRWDMIFFCAGTECPGTPLMAAELVAETITITGSEGSMEAALSEVSK